jgi:hypothetical protein
MASTTQENRRVMALCAFVTWNQTDVFSAQNVEKTIDGMGGSLEKLAHYLLAMIDVGNLARANRTLRARGAAHTLHIGSAGERAVEVRNRFVDSMFARYGMGGWGCNPTGPATQEQVTLWLDKYCEKLLALQLVVRQSSAKGIWPEVSLMPFGEVVRALRRMSAIDPLAISCRAMAQRNGGERARDYRALRQRLKETYPAAAAVAGITPVTEPTLKDAEVVLQALFKQSRQGTWGQVDR